MAGIGDPNIPPGPGRPKGLPNKATTKAREAISRFVDDNSELLQELLLEIRETEGPLAAFTCIQNLIEYHVPKLSRTDGDLNVKGNMTISWEKSE